MTAILSTENLTKRYGRKTAVDGLTLAIEEGQVFGLLGPNGSGKTTTLGIVLGAIRPTSGTWRWFDRSPSPSSRRAIGSILEGPNFYPWLSGGDCLALVAAIRGIPKTAAEPALKRVGLWDRRADPVSTYSLGMRQRLALASAILGDPRVLVLDEPTNGVDAAGIAEIRELITSIAREGKTIILASHILDEVQKVCTHLAVLKDGSLIDHGAIGVVLGASDVIEVAARDNARLIAEAKGLSLVLEAAVKADLVELSVAPEAELDEVNRFFYERGIVLSHLARRKRSLESRFLELLEQKP